MKFLCVFEVPGDRLFFATGRAPNLLRAEVAATFGSAKTVLVLVPQCGWSAGRLVAWLKVKFAARLHDNNTFKTKLSSVRVTLFWHLTVLEGLKDFLRQIRRLIGRRIHA